MYPKPRPWAAAVHSEPSRPAPDSNRKAYTREDPQRGSEEAGVAPQGWEEGLPVGADCRLSPEGRRKPARKRNRVSRLK